MCIRDSCKAVVQSCWMQEAVVTDCETSVSVLLPSALKMTVEGTAKTFASNNIGQWPYSPASGNSNNNV